MILNVKLITGESLQFKVEKQTCIVGRSAQCDVVIPHEAVSRKHCQIDYRDGELFVTDLGSINGVLVDGQKIAPNKPVKFQTFLTLSFGAVHSLQVELDEERTSVQQNPLLTTTLQLKEHKPRPMKIHEFKPVPSGVPKLKPEESDTLSMNNFIALCISVIIGFALFIFKDEIFLLIGLE